MKKVFIVSSLALSALSLSTFASTEKDIMRGDSTAALDKVLVEEEDRRHLNALEIGKNHQSLRQGDFTWPN